MLLDRVMYLNRDIYCIQKAHPKPWTAVARLRPDSLRRDILKAPT